MVLIDVFLRVEILATHCAASGVFPFLFCLELDPFYFHVGNWIEDWVRCWMRTISLPMTDLLRTLCDIRSEWSKILPTSKWAMMLYLLDYKALSTKFIICLRGQLACFIVIAIEGRERQTFYLYSSPSRRSSHLSWVSLTDLPISIRTHYSILFRWDHWPSSSRITSESDVIFIPLRWSIQPIPIQ